jgi:hypothetical protein
MSDGGRASFDSVGLPVYETAFLRRPLRDHQGRRSSSDASIEEFHHGPVSGDGLPLSRLVTGDRGRVVRAVVRTPRRGADVALAPVAAAGLAGSAVSTSRQLHQPPPELFA